MSRHEEITDTVVVWPAGEEKCHDPVWSVREILL